MGIKMTLTIELSPELEQRLQVQAQAHSQDVAAFVLAVLERNAPASLVTPRHASTPRQRAALAGYGKFAGCGFSSTDLLRDRREAATREMKAATHHNIAQPDAQGQQEPVA